MTPDQIDLARRAVACKGWRWMPGMRLECGDILIWSDEDRWHCGNNETWTRWRHDRIGQADRGSLPDLSDPATLGCLVALVREAWGDPGFYAAQGSTKIKGTDIFGWDTFGYLHGKSCKGMLYRSEAEALVAALETGGGGA